MKKIKRKLTILWLLVFCLASSSLGGFTDHPAQEMLLTEALDQVSEQYQVFFAYDSDLLRDIKVDVDLSQYLTLEEAVTGLLKKSGLKYDLVGPKYCVIYKDTREGSRTKRKLERKIRQIEALEKKGNFSLQRSTGSGKDQLPLQALSRGYSALKAAFPVAGTVNDEAGLPLIGVSILIKGTSRGTVTDLEGRFSLDLTDGQEVLVFSYTGYEPREVPVNGRSELQVTLSISVSQLDEVVVIGYGTQKKSDLTGAVSSVKAGEIMAYPATNVMQSLLGRAPGVEVMQSTGAPGGSINIRIRGTNSIIGDNEPLYVVDGVPLAGQPTNINNSDIQSVEILKDASATAIYGSRGANGVVLITTKAGVSGKTQVDLHIGYSVQTIRKKMDLMNAAEYAQLHNEQALNDGVAPYFSDAEVNMLGEGTDWQDQLFETAPILNTSLTINGGNEKTRYSLGGSVFQQEGIIAGSDYNRYSFRTKINHDISDKFRADVSLNISRLKTGRKDSGGGSRGTSMFNSAITSPPSAPLYNDDGSIFDFIALHPFVSPDQVNPLYYIEEEYRNILANVVLGNASLSYRPLPGLTIKVLGGIENRDDRSDVYQTREFRNSAGGAQVNTNQFTSLLSENTISYDKDFGGIHNLSAVAGFTLQNFLSKGLSASGSGFLSDVFETYNLGAAATPGIPNSGFTESTLLSYLGRINYSLNNKYLLTVSFRADGSSRFSEGNKWGYFPSGALAWRVSEEDFLKGNDFLSNLKLRVSWGLTGSQAIQPYATLNQLDAGNTVFGDNLFTTFAPGSRLPSDLKWETTEQFDVGVEFGILNNRLFITADYYIKNTRDLLNTVGLPSSLGYTTTIQNIGSVQNRGFELGIDARLFAGPDFNWSIYANGAFNRNEVKELAGGQDILTNFVGILILSDNVGILREGQPIGQFYGYLEDGYDENGFINYQDLNGDGAITAEDKTYIGDPNPDFIFGFNSTMSFKNFQLNFFLQGAMGNDIFNVNAASSIDYGRGLNTIREVFTDHWTPSNTSAKYPVITKNSSAEASDRFIEDGSYLRLKNIELAYSIPIGRSEKSPFRQFQIYVSGQNLLTSTKYSWWDPEVNSRGLGTSRGIDHYTYPISKSYTGGVRIGF